MGPDLLVYFRADQVKGPDPDMGLAFRIADLPGSEVGGEEDEERDHKRLQQRSGHVHRRGDGQVIDLLILQVGHGVAERGGLHDDVGVGEQQQLSGGLMGGQIQGVVFSQPAGG